MICDERTLLQEPIVDPDDDDGEDLRTRVCELVDGTPIRPATLNRLLCGPMRSSRFVTLIIGILDPRRHTLTVVNAGHFPPLLRRHGAGEVECLFARQSCLPLGVEESAEYREQTLDLAPGDLVFCFTDGVCDAMNPAGELYGLEALRQIICQTNPDPEHIAQAVVADVRRFAQGRLPPDVMSDVESHVATCDVCCRQIEQVPDDTLVQLAREAATFGFRNEASGKDSQPPKTPPAGSPGVQPQVSPTG